MKAQLLCLVAILVLSIKGELSAQFQDCNTAQVLCTKDPVVVNSVTGPGNFEDVMNNSCFEDQEHQSHWFTFYATKTGTFEFSIKPDGYLADYDFAMWEGGCPGTPGSSEVACNWLGAVVVPPYFATGVATDPAASFGEGSSLEFINTIQVNAGQVYYLLVDNITANGKGFTIYFNGTAEIGNPELSFTAGVFCNQSSQDLKTIKVEGLDSVPGTIEYFNKYSDAINGTNALANSVVTSNGNYYVTKTTPHGCKATQTISVTLENPNVLIGDVYTCGNPSTFDFNDLKKKEISGLDLADISFTYFLNQQDMLNNTNPIGNIVTVSQVIWAKAITKNGCVDLIPFNVNLEKPVISLSGTEEICPGKSVFLPINYNGRWPINVTVAINGGLNIKDFLIQGEPTVVQPQISTVYTITECIDTFGCSATVQGSYKVIVHKSPEIVNVVTDCSIYNGKPAFVVTVTGGDTASYQIDGIPGKFSDNIFVSDPLIEGNMYSFQLYDAYKCAVVQWTGEPTCDCDPNFAVSISENTPIKCFGDTNGELLANVSGGFPPFSYKWSEGSTTAKLSNLSVGNYTVTVTDANACTAVGTYTLTSPPQITLQYEILNPLCENEAGGSINITNIKGGTAPYIISLDGKIVPGVPAVFDQLNAGSYKINVNDVHNCKLDIPVEVKAGLPFNLELGPDISLAESETAKIALTGDLAEIVNIEWAGSYPYNCGNCTEFVYTPTGSGFFSFVASNANGCQATDTVNIALHLKSLSDKVFLPNTFSPDGDGVNDVFRPYYGNIAVAKSTLSVYNRWGAQLYFEEFTDEANGWNGKFNGKILNPDVYVYVLTVELANGETSVFKGDITVFK